MLKIIFLCASIWSYSSTVFAAGLTQSGDLYELTHEHTSTRHAHLSANTFTDLIGKELKKNPLKVFDPNVTVTIYQRGGHRVVRFHWSVRLVASTESARDWYIDRRGSILRGATTTEACAAAKQHVIDQDKLGDFTRRLPGVRIPNVFVRKTWSGTSITGYWCLWEYFGVAPKPK